jgi:hypothetical protein
VSGSTNGGSLQLSQTAIGGSGGGGKFLNQYGKGYGGSAGAASSSLTFNDVTTNAIQAQILSDTSVATDGANVGAKVANLLQAGAGNETWPPASAPTRLPATRAPTSSASSLPAPTKPTP